MTSSLNLSIVNDRTLTVPLTAGDYPPKKPILSTSGGANEINVSWIDPPKQLGPIDHYELVMNGEVGVQALDLQNNVKISCASKN